MANLKGSSFNKQIRDANFRLAAFGQKRNGTNSHRTHSEATRVKRDRYLKEFKQFCEKNELEGKLNELMNEANMAEFLAERLEGLSFSTQEDYVRGWSGMVQGLQQVNVSIDLDGQFFNDQMAIYSDGAVRSDPLQIDPSIVPSDVIAQLPQSSAVIAQLQYETGYRVSEACIVLNNIEHYLNDLKIMQVQGKGGQMIKEKIISLELRLMMLRLQRDMLRIPHQSSYYRVLQRFNMRSHSFRAFYIKELYEKKRAEGMSHIKACLFVSKEVNHHRIEIVEYYLAKFGGTS